MWRALHLEAADCLDTDAFLIYCLTGVVDQWGNPRTITTDRSMKLVRELKEVWEQHNNEIPFFHELFVNQTNWIFSRLSSPHITQAVEQLVKSCKCTFYTTLQSKCRCSPHNQHWTQQCGSSDTKPCLPILVKLLLLLKLWKTEKSTRGRSIIRCQYLHTSFRVVGSRNIFLLLIFNEASG